LDFCLLPVQLEPTRDVAFGVIVSSASTRSSSSYSFLKTNEWTNRSDCIILRCQNNI